MLLATRLLSLVARSRQRRRSTLELASLSDHQLKDIGVTRYDLFAAPHSR